MHPRTRIWSRLLLSHLAVVAIGAASVFVAVGAVAPGAFDSAMGHATAGMDGMGEMMRSLVRASFQDAVQGALAIGVAVAIVGSLVVSIALSVRLSRPITRLAAASERIAAGRYAERVAVDTEDELGALAQSFNTMAESLESTERRRLQLVGDVAHELRNPLAAIDGYLEGIEDGVLQPSGATIALLRTETERLSRLVNDLQELWRAEARQVPLSPAVLDAARAVGDCLERFSMPAAERRIVLRAEPGPAVAMRADPARLGQILDNFLSNALRYSTEGGTVRVSWASVGETVEIGVTDDGAGLTPEQLDQVFERFYRVDPSRSRALGGSGIGLAIARALAEAMGGGVSATSPGPGRGSTFTVRVPAA